MKKKADKNIIIKDSELSKADASIIEANQSQQVVILKFFTKNNLSRYSLSICKVSPLMNSPEKIGKTIFEPIDLPVDENQTIYIVFDKDSEQRSKDSEGNLLLSIKNEIPFDVMEDEVIALIEKDGDIQMIIDWAKPIIDEVLSPETIEILKEKTFHPESSEQPFYTRTSEKTQINDTAKETKISNYNFGKPLTWVVTLISLISIFEFISSLSNNEKLLNILIKITLVFSKNFFAGIFFFYWIKSLKKYSIAYLITFILLICVIFATSYFIGLYSSVFSVLIQSLVIFMFIKVFNK